MLKTVSSITNAIGALNYKGAWNASTNTPTITSSSGIKGDYYVVSVGGATNIDGISNWGIGDWIAFNGSVWERVEGGADLNGVNLSVSNNSTLGSDTTNTTKINGYMGVGVAATPSIGIFVNHTALTTTSQLGALFRPVGTSAATTLVAGAQTQVRTAAASFSVANAAGLYADNAVKGTGSTIDNLHGIYVQNQSAGTNNYGITSLVSSGANKWNIYASGTAANWFSGDVLVFGVGGLGYTTGSGGTVTQATSRTTGVTLNKTNGAITLVSAAGLATFQSFTVTNSTVAATDVVHVTQKSGTDLYQIFVTDTAAGSFQITFSTTGGITVEEPVFNFAVIKGVTA
jgi:hypothetical protein